LGVWTRYGDYLLSNLHVRYWVNGWDMSKENHGHDWLFPFLSSHMLCGGDAATTEPCRGPIPAQVLVEWSMWLPVDVSGKARFRDEALDKWKPDSTGEHVQVIRVAENIPDIEHFRGIVWLVYNGSGWEVVPMNKSRGTMRRFEEGEAYKELMAHPECK
jgi:hypothetical protein